MSSNSENGFNIVAILYVVYQIGVPVMGLYFLYRHATHDAHGFISFIGYMILSSIEGLLWPLAVWWVG